MKLVRVDELFDVEYGNQFDLSKLEILGKGNINFVSRSSKNNGVVAKVLAYKKRTPYEAGLITVTLGTGIPASRFSWIAKGRIFKHSLPQIKNLPCDWLPLGLRTDG